MTKKLKIYKIKKNTYKKVMMLGLATIVGMSLTGCVEKALVEKYDVVEQVSKSGLQSMGLRQILNVPGETFKLITEYTCDDSSKRSFRITSDKFLYIEVYTEGLPDDTLVYIDSIHIDTSIKFKYAAMDGILQDTMDDRIHNSMMIGFPINNETKYYGVNAVEGCNQQFIQGSYFGMNGYGTATIEQERYTEADYIKYGVYANKFQIVYDLLIKGPKDKDYRNVSVCTDFLVPIEIDTRSKVKTLYTKNI